MRLIDFNNAIPNKRNYGGMAGSKLGIDYNNEKWFLKFPKSTSSMVGKKLPSYTNSPLTEYLGSHIYKLLGYETQETLLGYKDNKLVVACKDFCHEKNAELSQYEEIRNRYLSNVEIDEEFDNSSIDKSNLNRILLHLENNPTFQEIENSTSRFWECAIIDGFINNNDRNAGNWGVLTFKDNSESLAPIYDNGASFYDKMTKEKVIYMEKCKILEESILNTTTSYEYNGHTLSYKNLLELNNIDKDKAVLNTVPNIEKNLFKIYELIDSIPSIDNNITILDEKVREFYKESLSIRYSKLVLPMYNKILSNTYSLENSIPINGGRKCKVKTNY